VEVRGSCLTGATKLLDAVQGGAWPRDSVDGARHSRQAGQTW
jgi:hypothetical protein